MGYCDSRTVRDTAIAHLQPSGKIPKFTTFFFSEFVGACRGNDVFWSVSGLVDPTRSSTDRFTPNLLGRRDIGTCSFGISSRFGLKLKYGTIRSTIPTTRVFQNPENENSYSWTQTVV